MFFSVVCLGMIYAIFLRFIICLRLQYSTH